jgi:hypothetical protein
MTPTARAGIWITSIAAACLLTGALAGGASASIEVYENSEQAARIGEVRSAKCKVRRRPTGRVFSAVGKTTDEAWRLGVDIYDFRGFGQEYPVPYGTVNPTVDFEQISGPLDFSNNYAFPGTPPGSSGAIAFRSDGRKLGIGIYALPNADYTGGVALAGAMRCRYPRR